MKKIKALFVGLNTVDMQFFVEGFPEANTKTKAHRNEIAAGGPATNASIAAALLGADATLISPIGKHSLSRFLGSDIVKQQVKLIDPIDNIESKPIFASIITDELNGERTIFSYHPENNYEQLLNELDLHDLTTYDIALFDGFYPDLAIPIAKKLKGLGIVTVLDGGSWKAGLSELLPYIDVAICSNDFSPPATQSTREVFLNLIKRGVSKAAITRGEKSIIYTEGKEPDEILVQKAKITDSLGAGDFFHGAFCYYYIKEANFKLALKKASDLATFSCKYHGTRSWIKEYLSIYSIKD